MESQTFEEAYRAYGDKILTMLYVKLGSHEDAEDLSQNVWLSVWRNLEQFNGNSTLYTWIYQIAINEFRSHIKRAWVNQQRSEYPAEDEVIEAWTDDIDLEQEFEAIELKDQIDQRIASLAYVFKEALVLRDMVGLTYEQISEITDTPINTVRSRIHRAREQVLA